MQITVTCSLLAAGVARKCSLRLGHLCGQPKIRGGMTDEEGEDEYCSSFWNFASALPVSQETSGLSMRRERPSL